MKKSKEMIALLQALKVIKQWHGDLAFHIYYKASPELKEIRAVLGDEVPKELAQ